MNSKENFTEFFYWTETQESAINSRKEWSLTYNLNVSCSVLIIMDL